MRHAIAIDLGGTHASIGVVSEHRLIASREVAVDAVHGLKPLLPHLRDATNELLNHVGLSAGQCMGLSLSVPCLIDFRARRIVSVNNKYPDAEKLDLPAWAKQAFHLPLALENDARAALIGETVAGAARGRQDVMMVTLGTGIGCAVLVGGTPYRTSQSQGGNLGGHIPVRLDGRPCTCGALGCMESEASGWALPLLAGEHPGFAESALARAQKLDFATAFALSDDGDAVATQLIQHCIHVWQVGIVGLVHVYGPEIVLLGGGIASRIGLAQEIETYVQRHAWAPTSPVRVVPAELGNHAALYSAIPLLEELKGR